MQPDPNPSGEPKLETLDSRLSEVWKLLGINAYSIEDTNNAFKEWQHDVWDSINMKGYKQDMGKEDFDTLGKKSESWKNWCSSSTSSMLVLAGENKRSPDYCWLSPVAVHMVQTIRAEQTKQEASPNRPTCAFHQCKNGDYHLGRKAAASMLGRVLAALLDQNKTVLDNDQKHSGIRQVLESFAGAVRDATTSDESFRKAIENAMLGIVNELEKGTTIWIVLDRLDKLERGARSLMLQILTNLVKQAQVVIKVLVITDYSCWGPTCRKEVDELAKDGKGNLVLFRWQEEDR